MTPLSDPRSMRPSLSTMSMSRTTRMASLLPQKPRTVTTSQRTRRKCLWFFATNIYHALMIPLFSFPHVQTFLRHPRPRKSSLAQFTRFVPGWVAIQAGVAFFFLAFMMVSIDLVVLSSCHAITTWCKRKNSGTCVCYPFIGCRSLQT